MEREKERRNLPGEAFQIAGKVASGKWSRLMIALDYIYCCMRFHVNDKEYLDLQFYNYKNRYRKNFLLKYHQKNKYK